MINIRDLTKVYHGKKRGKFVAVAHISEANKRTASNSPEDRISLRRYDAISYLALFLFLSFPVACASRQTKAIEQASSSPTPNLKLSPSPTPELPAIPQPANWRGGSKDFSIEWTGSNIVVKNIATNKKVFSARKLAANRLRTAYKFMFGKNGSPSFQNFDFRYTVLAVAGSIMFLKEISSHSPPSYTRVTYLAIDLKAPQKRASLKDFYAPQEILAALLGNEEIKQDFQIREEALTEAPKTLDVFFTLFHTDASGPTQASDKIYDNCWFPTNIFDSFAFIQVEHDKVVADLGVPCRAGMRDDDIRPLRLTLPLSDAVKTALAGEISVIKPDNQNQESLITFTDSRWPQVFRDEQGNGPIRIRVIGSLNHIRE
jgi:hypothetical protein